MRSLSLQELEAESSSYDACVARTVGIDRFCSSSYWVLPAHHAFAAWREPVVFSDGEGYAAFARFTTPEGMTLWQSLEAVWGLSSPLATASPRHLMHNFGALVATQPWHIMLVGGLEQGSEIWKAAVNGMAAHRLGLGPVTRRHLAELEGGIDGFLSRRSRNLRKSLQRSRRDAERRGIRFVDAGADHDVYARILAVEARSWKGMADSGLIAPEMRAFYADMIPRLRRHQSLRLWFAKKDDQDVGFILGGVFGDTYRGLQFSFDAEFTPLGLGNLLQLVQIEALCREGVRWYDLGTDVPYKVRWGERTFDTVTLIVRRR